MSEVTVERIMVCLDGSEGSVAALSLAINLASLLDAEVIAVHVLQVMHRVSPASGHLSGADVNLSPFERAVCTAVRTAFEQEWCAPLRAAHVRHRTTFLVGRPGPCLVEEADREGVDLILTGRRGSGSLNELLLGSVSQYLVHRAARPVLVVPHRPREDAGARVVSGSGARSPR